MTLYEKTFWGSSGKVEIKNPEKTRTQIGHTNDGNRLHVNLVPNYKKPLPGDIPCISKMRMSPPGSTIDISELDGKQVINKYGLVDFVPGKGTKRINSNSPIRIGYDLRRKTFYLEK